MFTVKTPYATYTNCVWHISGKGKYTRYDIFNDEGAVMTINVPGYGKSATVVAIKDYSENKGTMALLTKHKLIKRIVDYIPSGFVVLPVVELDIDKLKAM